MFAMVVWSGLGFLVAVIVFVAALACNLGFDAALGQGFYKAHLWTVGVAMLLAAAIVWPLGIWLRRRPTRELSTWIPASSSSSTPCTIRCFSYRFISGDRY